MNELALFAGAGGGLYATKWLLGWRAVCYVEWNKYCVEVLKARIRDGVFDDAPIWDNARTFDGTPWCGVVDIITAGFPCQPFSVAGNRLGEKDPRNMWPDTIRIIREVGAPLVFLENVSGLRYGSYFGRILGDLAESGYSVRWRVLSAAEVGAPHKRDRVFILANNRKERMEGIRSKQVYWESAFPWGKDVRRIEDLRSRPDIPQPLIRRMGNGLAHGRNRLEAIGNGQVPAVVATIWDLLTIETREKNLQQVTL